MIWLRRRWNLPMLNWMMSRKLRTKIVILIGVMAAVAILVGIVGLTRMSSMDQDSQALYEGGVLPLARIGQVQTDVQQTRVDALNHAVSQGDAGLAKFEQALAKDADA